MANDRPPAYHDSGFPGSGNAGIPARGQYFPQFIPFIPLICNSSPLTTTYPIPPGLNFLEDSTSLTKSGNI
jgi:hypothetical protein